MKNAIKCCISCILPCGSLDVIRIIHTDGYLEEISGTIRASEIMKANPRHVLKKPSSPTYTNEFGVAECSKIMILSPDVELKRGKIYILVPIPKTCPRSSSSLKKECKRKNSRVVEWRPRLNSISEATSDT